MLRNEGFPKGTGVSFGFIVSGTKSERLIPRLGGCGVVESPCRAREWYSGRMGESDVTSSAFLLWLADQAHGPDPLEFLGETAGDKLMPGDLEYLVGRLVELELVRVQAWREYRRTPARVALSPRGRQCVLSFGGDAAAWIETIVRT